MISLPSLPRPLWTIHLAAIILTFLGRANVGAGDCLPPILTGVFRSGNFPENYDEFASAVAANEKVMAVGARADGRSPAGALHVYTRHGATWEKQQRLRILDNPSANFLGEVLALDGDSIVAGLPQSDRVHVFAHEGTNWIPRQTVAPFNMVANIYFGYSVAIKDDIMVVGAPVESNVLGAAYIFIRAGTNWIENVKLLASDGRPGDAFGAAVAVDGERILVGSRRHAGVLYPGTGYVFRREVDGWTEEARLFADNPQPRDGDISVCLSGESAALHYWGFPNEVHLFARTNELWSRMQKIVATNASLETGFGFSLQMAGNYLAVGSPASRVGDGGLHGRVHLFTRQGGAWIHQETIESIAGYTEQYFGRAMSLYANGLLVGAHGLDSGPDRSGNAFLYEFDAAPPVIASASAMPNMLWPPNHKMVPVRVNVAAYDECGSVTCRITNVWSDHFLDEGDWEITSDLSVNLRATRNEDGTGRTYHIAVECVDDAGYATTTNVVVVVPHDLGNPRGLVNNGALALGLENPISSLGSVEAADDFTLTNCVSIRHITYFGLYEFVTNDNFTIRIFADADGKPATSPLLEFNVRRAHRSFVRTVKIPAEPKTIVLRFYRYFARLPRNELQLSPGRYWLSILNDTGGVKNWGIAGREPRTGHIHLRDSPTDPWHSSAPGYGFAFKLRGVRLRPCPE